MKSTETAAATKSSGAKVVGNESAKTYGKDTRTKGPGATRAQGEQAGTLAKDSGPALLSRAQQSKISKRGLNFINPRNAATKGPTRRS